MLNIISHQGEERKTTVRYNFILFILEWLLFKNHLHTHEHTEKITSTDEDLE